jgi:signal peptidase II
MKFLDRTSIYVAVTILGLVLDQATKIWADSHSLGWSIPIIGDFLRFTLIYNENAAFSMKPQSVLPWLSPTIFFGILTVIACAGAIYFFIGLPKKDYLSRFGIILIISGALGNFCDRLRIGKVVDFIDVDFPDFIFERWPTFNLADSWVTIGIALLFLSSFLLKFRSNSADTTKKGD